MTDHILKRNASTASTDSCVRVSRLRVRLKCALFWSKGVVMRTLYKGSCVLQSELPHCSAKTELCVRCIVYCYSHGSFALVARSVTLYCLPCQLCMLYLVRALCLCCNSHILLKYKTAARDRKLLHISFAVFLLFQNLTIVTS